MIPKFDFIEPLESYTIESVHLGDGVRVEVFGNPNVIAYEWILHRDHRIENHSNKGYGNVGVALRDGLIAALGMPEGVPS